MFISLFGSHPFLFLFLPGASPDHLEGLCVLMIFILMPTYRGVACTFLLFFRFIFVAAMGSVSIDVLRLDNLLYTSIVFRLTMTCALIMPWKLCLQGTRRLAFLFAFRFKVRMQLYIKFFVGLFKLLNISFRVFKEVYLLGFKLLYLGFQGVGVKFKLLLNLPKVRVTPILFLMSVSCFCRRSSSFPYYSSRSRALIISSRMRSRELRYC